MEQDPIKVWRDPTSYPFIPDHFIECPLGQDDLSHEYYSLSSQGVPSFYLKQENLMKENSMDKPLTTHTTTSPSKRAKTMASLAPSTLRMRVRVVREFIGFCAKWLHLPITMEHVLNPQVVAKYMGFHVAKGTSESSLHVYATHLHQVALTFVTTPTCPKMLPSIDAPTLASIMEWFSNLNSKLLASITSHYKAKPNLTLWRVWEACLSKWHTFQAKWVSEGGSGRAFAWQMTFPMKHVAHPTPHTPCFHPHNPGKEGQVDPLPCKGVPRVCALHVGGGPLPTPNEGGGLEAHPQRLLHEVHTPLCV
ncbi:MAG: hypothetical protein ACK5NY_08555 [Burkholderiaceae bacterium]